MIIKGKALKYGDDVNTDVIYPGRHLAITEPAEMAKHAMEDLDPDFMKKFAKGDIVVAGKNFGCGSSREQAATCLQYAGVGAIISKSFARIFFRNAINQGILILQSPDAVEGIDDMDAVSINTAKGIIRNEKTGAEFTIHPLPEFLQEIIDAGGLIPALKKKLGK